MPDRAERKAYQILSLLVVHQIDRHEQMGQRGRGTDASEGGEGEGVGYVVGVWWVAVEGIVCE
jgi:hypothetical protein